MTAKRVASAHKPESEASARMRRSAEAVERAEKLAKQNNAKRLAEGPYLSAGEILDRALMQGLEQMEAEL